MFANKLLGKCIWRKLDTILISKFVITDLNIPQQNLTYVHVMYDPEPSIYSGPRACFVPKLQTGAR